MRKYISCDCKCKLNSETCNSNQIIKHVNVSVKSIISVRKIKVGILALVFMKTASILKVLPIIQQLRVTKLHLLWIL